MTRKKQVKKIKQPALEVARDEVGTMVEMLNSLKVHPGWLFLKKILDENVFTQEKKILNDLYEKGLKYSEEDLEKQVRRIYIDLANFPEREIRRLTGADPQDEDYDPYFKDAKDL